MDTVIGVVGAGGWGTALAVLLDSRGVGTILWEALPANAGLLRKRRENARYLPGVPIPDGVEITCDIAALSRADGFLVTLRSEHLRRTLRALRPFAAGRPVLVCTKGIEERTGRRMSEIAAEALPGTPGAVLSGPTIASEVARGLPTAAVVASASAEAASFFQRVLSSERFRLYTTSDVAGVEYGGALKNVVAIGAGVIDGLGLGVNAKAAYISRGLEEMARFGAARGGLDRTFRGLSGLGDLITTCFSPSSRNRSFGEGVVKIGKDRYLGSAVMVIEGIGTCRAVRRMARAEGPEMPICEAVHRIVFLGRNPAAEVTRLMGRRLTTE